MKYALQSCLSQVLCSELVTLLQVRDMTGAGEVIKRRVKDGVGEFPADCPIEDCAVSVHLRIYPAQGQVRA